MAVVGIDACKGGWLAVVLASGHAPAGVHVGALAGILDVVPGVQAVGVDIPIGLPRRGYRSADVEARRLIGPRRSSVFFTPVRQALTSSTHTEASQTSRRLTGKGVSRQAYALAPKILEAEQWARDAAVPVWEVHPEVSFTVLLGRPAQFPKATWSGMRERLRALETAGLDLDAVGPAGGRAATDDVLDAAVVAWSAERLARGEGISLPDPPEVDEETGRPQAIWA